MPVIKHIVVKVALDVHTLEQQAVATLLAALAERARLDIRAMREDAPPLSDIQWQRVRRLLDNELASIHEGLTNAVDEAREGKSKH